MKVDIRTRLIKCCICGKYKVPNAESKKFMKEYGINPNEFEIICENCFDDYVEKTIRDVREK